MDFCYFAKKRRRKPRIHRILNSQFHQLREKMSSQLQLHRKDYSSQRGLRKLLGKRE